MSSSAAAPPATSLFCTGNQKKLEEVVAILAAGRELPFAVQPAAVDLPELQGEPEEIAAEKCRLAAERLQAAGEGVDGSRRAAQHQKFLVVHAGDY